MIRKPGYFVAVSEFVKSPIGSIIKSFQKAGIKVKNPEELAHVASVCIAFLQIFEETMTIPAIYHSSPADERGRIVVEEVKGKGITDLVEGIEDPGPLALILMDYIEEMAGAKGIVLTDPKNVKEAMGRYIG